MNADKRRCRQSAIRNPQSAIVGGGRPRELAAEVCDVADPRAINPLAQTLAREEQERLLDLFPARYRRLAQARYVDGRTTSEMARDLGVSVSTVKLWLRRARSRAAQTAQRKGTADEHR
jgi:RNA polymerase sigma factor (sigma-70 family)